MSESAAMTVPEASGQKAAAVSTLCRSCSAPTAFDPPSGGLKCPYCGAQKELPRGPVPSHPIAEMASLSAPPADQAKVLKCTQCGAQTTLSGNVAATRCAFCTAPLAPAENAQVPPAEGVVPFQVAKDAAGQHFTDWLGSLWFRPSNLKKLGRLREVRGVYVPNWAFDASASSEWTAEAGYYYDVEKTAVINGEEKTVTVQEIRWEDAAGSHQADYTDLLESASGGVSPKELKGIEPFSLGDQQTAFDGGFLAGFEAESHSLGVEQCWTQAFQRIEAMETSACAAEVPGDTHRALMVHTTTSDELVRSLLLPVYIAAYEYAGTVYRVLVNGQTGKVTGQAPWSVAKIVSFTLTMIALLAAGAALYLHFKRH